ncbi:hypothetical protein DL95DRAFT_496595 [Leptodontidium sp. 2 PMI_412]|nr:hypothetical protein DL95DRAFT_496595 [Leptodontidium sp. 2 PMI_412]
METSLLADITPTFEDLSQTEAQTQLDQLHEDYDQWVNEVFVQYQDYQYIPDVDELQRGRFRTTRTMTWDQRAAYRAHLTQLQAQSQDGENTDEDDSESSNTSHQSGLDNEEVHPTAFVEIRNIEDFKNYVDPIYIAWRHVTSIGKEFPTLAILGHLYSIWKYDDNPNWEYEFEETADVHKFLRSNNQKAIKFKRDAIKAEQECVQDRGTAGIVVESGDAVARWLLAYIIMLKPFHLFFGPYNPDEKQWQGLATQQWLRRQNDRSDAIDWFWTTMPGLIRSSPPEPLGRSTQALLPNATSELSTMDNTPEPPSSFAIDTETPQPELPRHRRAFRSPSESLLYSDCVIEDTAKVRKRLFVDLLSTRRHEDARLEWSPLKKDNSKTHKRKRSEVEHLKKPEKRGNTNEQRTIIRAADRDIQVTPRTFYYGK